MYAHDLGLGRGSGASVAKRLGEEWFFSGAFVVFYHISAIFLVFCLVIRGFLVYLPTVIMELIFL